MNEIEHEHDTQKDEAKPIIMILERRTQNRSELTSAEVMKILRKRGAKSLRRSPDDGSGGQGIPDE